MHVNPARLFLLLLFVLQFLKSYAQNMNSPYSVYGIGDIEHKYYNRTSGLAGTGLALNSSSYLINNNPASIAGLERSLLVSSIEATGKTSEYQGDPTNITNNVNRDFWIKGISFGIKVNKLWASSIGFSQFSNVNYKFTGSRTVEGSTDTYSTTYEGHGGLNDYHWTNAFSLGKHFSVGVKSSIIAGSINQIETINALYLNSTLSTNVKDYAGTARFQFGALYKMKLSKKLDVSFGGLYSAKTKIISERTISVFQNDESIIEDEITGYKRFWLPAIYAGGIAFSRKLNDRTTTFAADYKYENWESLRIKGDGWRLISSHKLSAGIEFSKHEKKINTSFEKKFYQAGAFIHKSYLRINGQPLNEYGITAGMGGIVGKNLPYSLSVEAGSRGTTTSGLIKETYFQFTIAFSLRDYIFSKGRKYY